MSEENTPDLAAIEAQVRAKVEAEFNEERTRLVGHNDKLVEEKRQLETKYKGFDQGQMEGYQNYLKELENNEEMRLISEGKHDEVIQRRMAGREKAWNETQAEYDKRLQASQEQAEELQSMLDQANIEKSDMRTNQYLKDVTGSDDSFKSPHYDHFYKLYKSRVEFDESNGKAYALEDGKRVVDTAGNFVTFEEFYAKEKINDGLFWNGGSGSGQKSGGGSGSSTPFSKMTFEQRNDLRKELGPQKYAEFVKQNASK